MRIINLLILLVVVTTNYQAFANTNRKIENEGVVQFISDKIKESLINMNTFIFNPKMTDIQIKLDSKKINNLPFDIEQIESVKVIDVNKVTNSFKGEIVINDGNINSFKENIQGKYIEVANIPSFKKRMKTGYIIEDEDIEVISIDAKKLTHEIIEDKEELLGKTPKYSIAPHTPIKREILGIPNIISKNDLVTVIYQKDNIELKMIGIAIEAGGIGDTIRIQNTKSNSIIHGIIENNKVVKVH